MASHLGVLVRAAREQAGWPQERLAERLRLARPISVSKWERGEAPIPVHHWQGLMRLLTITRRAFLLAAQQDGHHQLRLFQALSSSAGDQEQVGQATWTCILQSLDPVTAERAEALRTQHPDVSPAAFMTLAIASFVNQMDVTEKAARKEKRTRPQVRILQPMVLEG